MKHNEIQFKEYIVNELRLAESTANHYAQAIKTIMRILRDNGISPSDIYSIDSVVELERIREELRNIQEFVDLDTTGKKMYSNGLARYIEFIRWSDGK